MKRETSAAAYRCMAEGQSPWARAWTAALDVCAACGDIMCYAFTCTFILCVT